MTLLDDIGIIIRKVGALTPSSPPGPKPDRFGDDVQWNPQSHRWVKQEERSEYSGVRRGNESISAREIEGEPGYLNQVAIRHDIDVNANFSPEEESSYVNPEEHDALMYYISDGYISVNEALRDGSELDGHDRRVLEGMVEMSEPLGDDYPTLYRGVFIPDDIEEGFVKQLDSFISTSRQFRIASYFAADDDDTLMELHVHPDVRGITLSDEDTWEEESETIIAPGHELHIHSVGYVSRSYGNKIDVQPGKPLPEGARQFVVGTIAPSGYAIEKMLVKAGPPGPKPERYGDDVQWNPSTHRWTKKPDARSGKRRGVAPISERSVFPSSMVAREHDRDILNSFKPEEQDSYLSASENYAVADYTGDMHEEINDFMRSGDFDPDSEWHDDNQEIVENIYDLVDSASPLGEDYPTLYRGIDVHYEDMNITEGSALPVDSFMSTTRSVETASGFAFGVGTTIMELHVSPNSRGITLSNEDTEHDEHETILMPDHEVHVHSVKYFNNKTGEEIDADILGDYSRLRSDSVYVRRYVVGTVVPSDISVYKMLLNNLTPAPPPGPKPERYGDDVEWNPTSRRWVRNDGNSTIKPLSSDLSNDGNLYTDIERYDLDNEDSLGEFTRNTESYVDVNESENLYSYTQDSRPYNEYMSGKFQGGTERRIDIIQSVITDIVELAKPLGNDYPTLYRGMYSFYGDDLVEGAVVPVDSFMSTSRKPGTALNFMSGGDSFLLEMQVHPDVRGLTLDDEDTYMDEQETILMPSELEIHSVAYYDYETGEQVANPQDNDNTIHYIVASVRPQGVA